jgi:propanol-preferring alcohol dehydrogenase
VPYGYSCRRGRLAGKPSVPFIPGHEAAGIVAALGPDVTDFREGDAVGVAWLHDACMRCEYCETGWETVCEHQHNTGYSCNGGFAEYVIASAPFAARLPVGVDFAAIAPILCAGVTTYKGLKENRGEAGRMGCHIGHWRSRAGGHPVRQGDGVARGRARHRG